MPTFISTHKWQVIILPLLKCGVSFLIVDSCLVRQTEESTVVEGRKSSVEADAKEHKAVEGTTLR